MIKKINTMYFTSEHIKAGILNDFILLMYKYSLTSNNYIDIHIKPIDLGEVEVEWVYVSKDEDFCGGKFKYVGNNQVVLNKVFFPDNHCEYLTDEEAVDAVENWAKENNYVKNQFGQWEEKKADTNIVKQWKDQNL